MANSTTVTADGVQTDFSVTFPFLDRAHVKVRLSGVLQSPPAYSWVTASSIRFASPPAYGALVYISRETPLTPVTDFSDGATLDANSLDRALRQPLYLVEDLETGDTSIEAGAILADSYAYTNAREAAIRADFPTGGGGTGPGAAADVSLVDTGGYFVGATVEAALQEAGAADASIRTPSYLVLTNTANLDNERRLVAGTNITFTDGGPGGALTINAAGGGGGGASTANAVTISDAGGFYSATHVEDALQEVWSAKAAAAHTHTIANVTGLQAALDAKAAAGTLSGSSGDSQIGFQQTGTGSVSRTLAGLIDDGPLYAKDFGATGDGTTDDTTALQNAINAAISQTRELILHAGVFKVTAPLNAVGILRMRGQGSGSFAYGPLAEVNTTVIRMVNATNQTHVLKLENANTGADISRLQIDANTDALVGLDLKSVLRSTFTDLYVRRAVTFCVRLWCNDNANTMWNTFTNLQINSTEAGSIGLYVSGANPNTELANSCHNVFITTKIDYAGLNSEGLRIGNSDNNIFYQTYIYSPNSTEAQGVTLVKESTANFPVGTGFYHLQTSVKGMFVESGLNDNYVYGYATDNAQPDPVWNPDTSRFFWTDGAGRISNVRSMKELSVESGNPVRLNGYLVGNTWIAGNASSITMTVNGATAVSWGATGNTIYQPTTFNAAATFGSSVTLNGSGELIVQSGNRVRLAGAGSLSGMRFSSGCVEVFSGASFAAGFSDTKVGFCGATPVTKPTVSGAKGGNAALTSLITALASMGLITDTTT